MSAARNDTPPVLAGLLGLIVLLLLVSIGLQAGVVNPTAQSTQSEVRQIACAIAEQTANGSRVRTENPKTGEVETREHFLTRMLAQRHTLLIASGTGCDSAPGFPPFDVQVARALREINQILGYRPRTLDATGEPTSGDAPAASGGSGHPTASAPPVNGSTGSAGPGQGGSDAAPAPANPGTPAPVTPQEAASDPTPAAPSPSPTATQPPSTPSNGGSTVTNPASPVIPTSPPETPAAPAVDPGVVQSTIERVDGAVTPTVCAVAEVLRGTCP